MWLVGALIAACGTTTYIELGTVCFFLSESNIGTMLIYFIKGLPRSGGEKTYLEYIYRRPKFMVTCIFAVYVIMASHLYADFTAIFIHVWQGTSPSNTIVFSECTYLNFFIFLVWEFTYILDLLHSLDIAPTWLNTRLVVFTCLTLVCLVHGTLLKVGLRLQNTLGALKLLVLALIPVSGILYLAGVKGIEIGDEYEKPNNFTWDTFWEGSGTGPSAFVNGLYNVIWCESSASYCIYFLLTTSRSFTGYSGINSVLSEVRDPVRTIKLAAPLAMISVAAVYLFINISYFAVVSKRDILESQRIIALESCCLVIPFIIIYSTVLKSLIFPKSIRSYDREGGFLVTYCILVCWCFTHYRPLAASLHYLLWETY